MDSETKLCNRANSRNASVLLHTPYSKKSDSFFGTTRYSENRAGGDDSGVRDTSINSSYLYSFTECVSVSSLSQTRTHLQNSIPNPPEGRKFSDLNHNDNINSKAQKGLQEVGCDDGVLNDVKDEVWGPKGGSDWGAKYRGKATRLRGILKAQVHYSTAGGKDGEVRKGCEKSAALREHVDTLEVSSYGCREGCDEGGTSHVDEEETLESSEFSAARQTPLDFMQTNEKLRVWVEPDLESSGSFLLDGGDPKAPLSKENQSVLDQKKAEKASGAHCVILPRTHGVNTMLSRTVDQCPASSTPLRAFLPKETLPTPPLLSSSLLDEARRSLAAALFQAVRLELHSTSAGGTYTVYRLPSPPPKEKEKGREKERERRREKNVALAVFKPREEEIGQPGNPHGNCRSDRAGFAPGSGSRREVLAYGLDHGHRAGVPPTLEGSAVYCLNASREGAMCPNLSETAPSKVCVGSLQCFVPDCIDAADVLPGKFIVEEVHALAIFDIRTLNSDRHGGNVLVRYDMHDNWKEATPHLVPIDHSYICPSGYADPDYEWLSWPQSKVPFSAESLDYIRKLDASADADLVAVALTGNGAGQTDPFYPTQGASCDPFEGDSSSALAQNVLHVKNKQWMIEDLWLMSSPLRQRQSTPCICEDSSHPDFPKSTKYRDSLCGERSHEDVQAAANTLYCATRLLQVAALEFGLTAYDIGNMCRRPRLTCPSLLEELIEGSLDETTWETDRGVFESLLMKRLETATISALER